MFRVRGWVHGSGFRKQGFGFRLSGSLNLGLGDKVWEA